MYEVSNRLIVYWRFVVSPLWFISTAIRLRQTRRMLIDAPRRFTQRFEAKLAASLLRNYDGFE